jgi:hypothetical protein
LPRGPEPSLLYPFFTAKMTWRASVVQLSARMLLQLPTCCKPTSLQPLAPHTILFPAGIIAAGTGDGLQPPGHPPLEHIDLHHGPELPVLVPVCGECERRAQVIPVLMGCVSRSCIFSNVQPYC